MTLYSHNGKTPKPLPERIRLPSGATRTDSSTYTEEDITAAGYMLAPTKPLVEYPNRIEWGGTDWVVRPPNEQETATQWTTIKNQCQQLLNVTDYKVIKAYELNEPLDPAYVTYRQELRDLYNNVNDIDPWNVVWPSKPGDADAS